AQAVLAFAPQSAGDTVGKVLASAIANAEHNVRLERETLVVSRAWVDEGPTLKRFRPRAQGRAYRINKRTSHITVIVAERPGEEAAGRAPAKRSAARQGTSNVADAKPAAKRSTKRRGATVSGEVAPDD